MIKQARDYANQGKSLSLLYSGSFFWQACFNILVQTGYSAVIISDATRPMPLINSKRRSEDLLDGL